MKVNLLIAGFFVACGLLFGLSCDRLQPSAPVDHWPLDGAHADATCEACHGATLGPVSDECASCHLAVRPESHYEGPCGNCHSTTSWRDKVVDHSFFPLEGGHDVACSDCHGTSGDYTGLQSDCSACHESDRPDEDHHPGEDCGDCHAISAWSD